MSQVSLSQVTDTSRSFFSLVLITDSFLSILKNKHSIETARWPSVFCHQVACSGNTWFGNHKHGLGQATEHSQQPHPTPVTHGTFMCCCLLTLWIKQHQTLQPGTYVWQMGVCIGCISNKINMHHCSKVHCTKCHNESEWLPCCTGCGQKHDTQEEG